MIDPHKDTTTGYHLFLDPDEALSEEVSTIIEKLSSEYGGPAFTPHVTLLAMIPGTDEAEIARLSSKLISNLSPFMLTLGPCEMEDAYFRALYLTVKEQEFIRDLHEKASGLFSMQPNPSYKAHMSLLYGNYPAEQKEKTIESLPNLTDRSFLVDRLYLYRTEGKVTQWQKIAEFPFGTE